MFTGVGVRNLIFLFNKDKHLEKITSKYDWISIDESQLIDRVEFDFNNLHSLKKNYSPVSSMIQSQSNCERLGDIGYFSYGMRLCGEDDKGNKFKKKEIISKVKDKKFSKELIEGTSIYDFQINTKYFLEWNTKRVPEYLARPTFKELYEPDKIVVTKIGRRPNLALDTKGRVCDQSVMVFVPFSSLKKVNNRSFLKTIKWNNKQRSELEKISLRFDLIYILGIISSKLSYFFLNSQRQNPLWLAPDEWKELPIKYISDKRQKSIKDIIKRIIDEFEINENSKLLKELFDKLNSKVYQIYGLSKEEIKIIEESVK